MDDIAISAPRAGEAQPPTLGELLRKPRTARGAPLPNSRNCMPKSSEACFRPLQTGVPSRTNYIEVEFLGRVRPPLPELGRACVWHAQLSGGTARPHAKTVLPGVLWRGPSHIQILAETEQIHCSSVVASTSTVVFPMVFARDASDMLR